jgi:hypothetical protein
MRLPSGGGTVVLRGCPTCVLSGTLVSGLQESSARTQGQNMQVRATIHGIKLPCCAAPERIGITSRFPGSASLALTDFCVQVWALFQSQYAAYQAIVRLNGYRWVPILPFPQTALC